MHHSSAIAGYQILTVTLVRFDSCSWNFGSPHTAFTFVSFIRTPAVQAVSFLISHHQTCNLCFCRSQTSRHHLRRFHCSQPWTAGIPSRHLGHGRETERFTLVSGLPLLTSITDRSGDHAHTLRLILTYISSPPSFLIGILCQHPPLTPPITTLNLLQDTLWHRTSADWNNCCIFFLYHLNCSSILFKLEKPESNKRFSLPWGRPVRFKCSIFPRWYLPLSPAY